MTDRIGKAPTSERRFETAIWLGAGALTVGIGTAAIPV